MGTVQESLPDKDTSAEASIAPARAHDVVAFETRVAEVSWTKTQQRDPVETYNPMTIAELQKLGLGG